MLLLILDEESHPGFQMTWKLSTLDDLKGHWQPVILHWQLGFLFSLTVCGYCATK